MAKGYTTGEGGVRPAQRIDMSVPSAAGGLVGDAADVVRWGNALHHGRVVSPPLYAQMIAPTRLPGGTTAPYGFGLMTGTLRDMATVGHSGGIFGFASDSVYLPRYDVFVTVLTNSDHPQSSPGQVMRRLAALAAGRPYPEFTAQPLDVAAVQPFLGTYRIAGKERVLNVEDGKLVYRRSDGASPLVPVGDNRYAFGADGVSWIELRRGTGGTPAIVYFDDGKDTGGPSPRVGPLPVEAATVVVPAEALRRYAGSYTAPIGKVVVASAENDNLTVQLAGQPALALRALGLAEFEVERVRARVRFVETGGKVVRLEIVQGGRTIPATRD